MAISYKSSLYDSERIFTIAVDWHEDRPVEGILYQGEGGTRARFTGYYELAWEMEQCFAQLQYPRPVMDRRELFSGKADIERAGIPGEAPAGTGSASRYTIRVTQRQNASWQGNVSKGDGALYVFSSFLQLVAYLERDLGGIADSKAAGEEGCQQYLERYLGIVMNCQEKMKILPDTLVYRFCREGRSQTFMIRPMFYEHDTCQGTLYWKEYRKQVNFRSFLELVGMMGSAVRNQGSWDGETEAV